jgi:hypothetical protein
MVDLLFLRQMKFKAGITIPVFFINDSIATEFL